MLAELDRRSLSPRAYLRLDPEQPALAPPPSRAEAPRISIAIPTQRRPRGLATAVRSTIRQTGVDFARLELVIVDNDAEPSAEALVAELAAMAPFPVRYAHEPSAGVANARNMALATASGDLIAFLDDDEEAAPGWLAALIEIQQRYDADAVFGPVHARTPDRIRDHKAYLETFFSREGPSESGIIAHFYGCGDSLVRRAALPHPTAAFSPERNQTGGEDDLLFGEMKRRGARFAWAREALVYEDPAPERLNLNYALERAFAFGQGPTYGAFSASPRDWKAIARLMTTGTIQIGVFGLLSAVHWAVRSPRRAFAFDRVARGVGKVFFGGVFARRFYGRQVPAPVTAG